MRLVSLALLILSLAACDSAADAEPTFGDAYRLVAEPAPALVIEPVSTDPDARLAVTVEYSGGCEEHAFVLRSRDLGGEMEVWFVHDARGDACEAILTEMLTADLPGAAVAAETLVLVSPSGERVALR